MSELLNFIQAYLNTANMNGIDAENPIPFVVISPEGQLNQGKKFIVQVGYTEPTFNQLPYNVLWICFDKTLSHYAKLYRRIAHHPNPLTPDLRYTWEEITDYGIIYEKEQYYRPVADLDLVDGDSQIDPIMAASKESLGTVKTNADEVEPRAILSDDERMSDARDPKDHVHANVPRTMLKTFTYEVPVLDGEGNPVVIDGQEVKEMKRAYAKVDTAYPPAAGEILFLKEQDPNDANVWIAEWRKVRADDIEYLGPNLIAVEIVQPTDNYGDNSSYTFRAVLKWDDESQEDATEKLEWSVSENSQSITIDPVSGELVVPDINEDTALSVSVTYDKDGAALTDSVNIVIKDSFIPVTPSRIEISGPTRVNELEVGQYTVKLYMSDGSSSPITPDSFVSSNTDAAIIGTDGKLTTYNVDMDQNVTITAQYTIDGVTLTATFDLVVVDLQTVGGLVIRGATTMDEGTSEIYEVYVTYGDNTEAKVTPESFTIKSGGAHASLDGMTLTANDVVGDQNVTLEAKYTEKGKALTDTHIVKIKDLTAYPDRLEVGYLSAMDESSSQDITVEVVYTDGSRVPVPNPDSVVSNDETIITVDGLTLNSASVTMGTSTGIVITHTVEGQELTKTIYVSVRNSESAPTGIVVSGSSTVNEGAYANLTVEFRMDDGSRIPFTEFDNLTAVSSNTDLLTVAPLTPPTYRATVVGDVIANTPVDITFTYNDGTNNWTATHRITVVDSVKKLVDFEVTGPATVTVGEANSTPYIYGVRGINDDGTKTAIQYKEMQVVGSFASLQSASNPRLLFNIQEEDMVADRTLTIRGSYELNGVVEWREMEVTVVPMDIADLTFNLVGDSNVDEGAQTSAYSVEVVGDGWKSTSATLNNLRIEGNAHGATVNGTRILAPTNLVANQNITLVGTLSWRGQNGIETRNFALRLNNSIPDYVSSVFVVAKSIYEPGEEINPTVVEYTTSDTKKHAAVAKQVTITAGASAVNVSGTGASTRFTVKDDNATVTTVTWAGIVTVDGVDRNVTAKSVTANKATTTPEFPFMYGFTMAPAYMPKEYEADLGLVLSYFGTDKNAMEITEAMTASEFLVRNDIQGYPMTMDEAFTAYFITDPAWGQMVLKDPATGSLLTWLGARQPITGEPANSDTTIGNPPYDNPPYADIQYAGKTYRLYRFHFPKTSGPNPAVEQMNVSFV